MATTDRRRRILVVGASRGIGHAVAAHLAPTTEHLWTVSRTQPVHGEWIEADLSTNSGVDAVIERLSDTTLDALLYTGGTWERGAFTADYDFESAPITEIDHVIAVNLLAPIKLVHGLAPALRRADDPRVVVIGALSGLDHAATREVANSASKYGLRGAAQALALAARDIPVTVINPGNVATDEVVDDIARGRFEQQVPIPLSDLLATVDYALTLSAASVASEINLAQTRM